MHVTDSGDEEEPEEAEAGAIDDDQEEYRAPPEAEHSEDSEIVGEEDDGDPKGSSGAFKNIQVWVEEMMECVSCSGDNDGSVFYLFLNVTHFLHFPLFLFLGFFFWDILWSDCNSKTF